MYPYCDTAYRLRSDTTDQVVSRNHRIIVERGGEFVFEVAEKAAWKCEVRVPILESLSELQRYLPLSHKGTDSKKQNMFSGMRVGTNVEEPVREEYRVASTSHKSDVLSLWQGDNSPTSEQFENDTCRIYLQQQMQWQEQSERTCQTLAQGTSRLDRRVETSVKRANARSKQSSLEGRSYNLEKEGELYSVEDGTLPERISNNGQERRLHYGAPTSRRSAVGKMPVAFGSSAPRRSQQNEQQPRESDAVREQQGSQIVRSSRRTRTTLARIEPVFYSGIVWCVQVPTGAFVARRNDKIFVTGNSGFPKSLDVSKAIDKQLGAEREVIGHRTDGRYGRG